MQFSYEETITQMLKEFCMINNLDANNIDDRMKFYKCILKKLENKTVV